MTVSLNDVKSGLVSCLSALIASLCCLLPLAVVLLGLGSGAFMMVTMQYRSVFLPIGVIGVTLGYVLYFRERRRCSGAGCALLGRRSNMVLLLFATLVVTAAIILDLFPQLTSQWLQGAV